MRSSFQRMTAEHKLRMQKGRIAVAFSTFILCLTVAALVLPAVALEKKEFIADYPQEVHEHSESCYDADGNLICTLPEIEEDKLDEESTKQVEETEEEPGTEEVAEEKAEPAVDEKTDENQTLIFEESTDEVTVHVEADHDAFPEGTIMKVTAVAQEDVTEPISGAVDGDIRTIKAVDITFINAEGKEIEPAKPICVSMTSKGKNKDNEADLSVVHVDDEGKASKVEEVDIEKKTKETIATFEAGEFSVYAVVYTVDFHYEVDGETYDFNIPGGGFVSLSKLIEVLGVVKDTGEDARKFVEDIDQVEFSDPELVWVGKTEANVSVGKIKKENDLEAEYSKELTKEDIEEIDSQEVEAGDWALISLKAFTSEESLTVTMKNGDVWTVKVTDDQDSLGLDGKTYIISYNNLAMLGEGESNQYRKQLNTGAASDERAPWKITYNSARGGYYLQSYNGKYLKLEPTDYNRTLRDVSLVDSVNNATVLSIEKSGNSFRISGKQQYNNQSFKVCYHENGQYDPYFAGQYAANGGQEWLTLTEYTPPASHMDWLLYTDEDKEITIHVGDTITLRPYGEWEWKDGNIQSKYWNIPLPGGQNWRINNSDGNASRMLSWTDGIFDFKRFVKEDGELHTKYWSLQGTAKRTGDYVLHSSTGNTITVHVVDGNSDPLPKTITKTANIKVNLFDYDRDAVLDPANDKNLANSAYNQSINYNNKPFKFLSSGSGNTSGHYNSNTHYYSDTQFDLNDYTGDRPHKGLVQNTLTDDGYPRLSSSYDRNQSSLKYLFDTSQTSWTSYGGMIAYPDVNGLFQVDEDGYYYFNSNANYAYYDTGKGKITLYEHTYTQVSKSNGEVNTKPIGFFPFHPYNSSSDLWVNQNSDLNHHLGLSMDIDFILPSNKLDENGEEIIFDFSGDDDLWVFAEWIDANGNKHSKQLLDLGGIHQPITGKINFSDNSTGLVADQVYTLKVFYLERGGCDSNCSIRFNLPVVKDLTVAKKLNGLTPVERQKYLNDLFVYEIGLKTDEYILPDYADINDYWENSAQEWRSHFALYNTTAAQKDARNHTIAYRWNADHTALEKQEGEAIQNGHVTLKADESMTITRLRRSDIFYLAEENELDMAQFETPHAERLYFNASDQKEHEEEVYLHGDHAVSDNLADWETKPYALMDTEKLVYTNTLQERNVDVEKIWADGNDRHSEDSVIFKLKAKVDNTDYVQYMAQHNYASYNNINAQWTETKNNVTTTRTEDVLNKEYTLSAANNWKISFEHLPKKTQDPNGTGKDITYFVEEVSVKDGYTPEVKPLTDTNEVYLDLYKFWPDDNGNHDGSSEDKKVENIFTYVKRSDGKYLTGDYAGNGEYVYTGAVANVNEATRFLITSKTRLGNLNTDDQKEMFDYSARINGVPETDGDSDNPTAYNYALEQAVDNNATTTGLVMFTRPKEEIEILNTPASTDLTIQKNDEKGAGLANAVFQLQVKDSDDVYRPVSLVEGYKTITGLETKTLGAKDGVGGVEHTSTFTSTTTGMTFRGLPDGDYRLVELQAPEGYVIESPNTDFTISKQKLNGNDVERRVQFDKDNALITVINKPGVALPNTGGRGTGIFTLLGSLMVFGAGAILLRERKKTLWSRFD